MTDQVQINHLMDWANDFDPNILHTEDDVETKFVIPFFQHLGFTSEYRRGKYPISGYRSNRPSSKAGRKPEIDQIYFSVSEPAKQNADNALLLVEAKKAQQHNIEEAVPQAQDYANYLKPLFVVVTNGIRIKVFKRHQYREDEPVFDLTLYDLCKEEVVAEVFNQLQFEILKKLKEQTLDPLVHVQHIKLMQILEQYPDIQEQLEQGDFKPATIRRERLLTIVKPKVVISGELPIVFDEGNCNIEFSNIMLRGLKISLSHNEILSSLCVGLNTPPNWSTRSFLRRTEQNTFEATLGKTIVILSESEAFELGNVVDEFCQQYKDSLINTTNVLETWSFRLVTTEGEKGFELLSIKRWLWDAMKKFSREFDYGRGDSEWHIFDRQNWGIRVSRKAIDHVIIFPKFENTFSSSNEVDLLYVDSITYLYLYHDKPEDSIFKNVGPHGAWTATYTKQWLKQQFIPMVISYYSLSAKGIRMGFTQRTFSKMFFLSKLYQKRQDATMESSIYDYISEDIPLANIHEPEQFLPYLHHIQSWFHHYHFYGAFNIAAPPLRSYYSTFTELASAADPATVNIDYIQGKANGIKYWMEQNEEEEGNQPDLITYSDVISFLKKQVTRIQAANYEYHGIADLLSRIFIAIIEDGTIRFQQNQINAAKDALVPLWEQYRFFEHFIDPINLEAQP